MGKSKFSNANPGAWNSYLRVGTVFMANVCLKTIKYVVTFFQLLHLRPRPMRTTIPRRGLNGQNLTSQISATSFASRAGGEKRKVYNLTPITENTVWLRLLRGTVWHRQWKYDLTPITLQIQFDPIIEGCSEHFEYILSVTRWIADMDCEYGVQYIRVCKCVKVYL